MSRASRVSGCLPDWLTSRSRTTSLWHVYTVLVVVVLWGDGYPSKPTWMPLAYLPADEGAGGVVAAREEGLLPDALAVQLVAVHRDLHQHPATKPKETLECTVCRFVWALEISDLLLASPIGEPSG